MVKRQIPTVSDQKLKTTIASLAVVISNINEEDMKCALIECPLCDFLNNEYIDVLTNLHASIKNIRSFKKEKLCRE